MDATKSRQAELTGGGDGKPTPRETPHDEGRAGFRSLVEGVGTHLIGLSALVYGTGILVTSTYFGRWNLTDFSGSELFRARYLQTGLFAMAPPMLCGMSVFTYFFFRKQSQAAERQPKLGAHVTSRKKEGFSMRTCASRIRRAFAAEHKDGSKKSWWPRRFYCFGMLSYLNMFLVLSIGAALGRPAWFAAPLFQWLFVSIPIVTIVGSFLITHEIDPLLRPNIGRTFQFVILVILDIALIYACPGFEFGKVLAEILRAHLPALIQYCVMSALILALVLGAWSKVAFSKDPTERTLVWTLIAFVTVPLYYYAAVGFAFSVFPYIPAAKGGADFTGVGRVSLVVSPASSLPLTEEHLVPISHAPKRESSESLPRLSVPLVLLEESAHWLYVAKADKWEVAEWRVGYKANAGGGRDVIKPDILRVKRDTVAGIAHSD